jgi:hypothetical protein
MYLYFRFCEDTDAWRAVSGSAIRFSIRLTLHSKYSKLAWDRSVHQLHLDLEAGRGRSCKVQLMQRSCKGGEDVQNQSFGQNMRVDDAIRCIE